ncbi:class I SAM-dependent methyltransferase [Halobacteriales archaeon Cl-PHB]
MDRFQNTRQPDWDWWGRLWPTPGATLRRLGLSTGDSVVEIGSGNGYFALPAARVVDPAPVYALDLDETVLDELDHLATLQEIDNAVPVLGDARSLSETLAEPVDVALLANAFHGIDDTAAVVEEVVAMLAPSGRFVVVNWQARPRAETTIAGEERGPPTEMRLSPSETRATVEAATDLSATAEIDLPPYHYALVFER